MEDYKIKVYVKLNSNNIITQIESSISNLDFTKFIQIDEGDGDKYAHAQNNYFPKGIPLRDIQGKYNYKLVDNKVVELTTEEKEKLFPPIIPQPSQQELLNAKILKDSLDIQAKLSMQQKLNADLLLKLSKIGGTANV